MAKLADNKQYVVVEQGDNLSRIAQTYSSYTGGASYQTLASWNNISNPNLIHPGQKIYLSKNGGTSAASKTTATGTMVTVTQFGMQSDSTNTLFIAWTFANSNKVEKYKVAWRYYAKGYSQWQETETTDIYHTYTIPSNVSVTKVEAKVIPVLKANAGITVKWCSTKSYYGGVLPNTPSNLTAKMEGLKLTAEVTNVDSTSTMIIFQYAENDVAVGSGTKATIKLGKASIEWTNKVKAGNVYKVRCRGYSDSGSGPWSDWSQEFTTIPGTPTKFTKCEPASNQGVDNINLEWPEIKSATSYELEYTTNETYFDKTDSEVTKKTCPQNTWIITEGIERGMKYYFRVKAVNSIGESDWSEVASTMIADWPAAPTVWSSSTVVGSTDPLTLYWVHNSEDNSLETSAHIIIAVDGATQVDIDVAKNPTEAEKGIAGSYEFKMVNLDGSPCYPNGGTLKWKIQTAGASNTYGDWSEERTVQIYTQPVLDLSVTNASEEILESDVCYLVEHVTDDLYITTATAVSIKDGTGYLVDGMYTVDDIPIRQGTTTAGETVYYWVDTRRLTSFPIKIKASVSPDTLNQTPVMYHIRVVSNSEYETMDEKGVAQSITEGMEVYSKHFDGLGVNPLEETISAGDVHLEDGATYTLTCTVGMSSGLNAEASRAFSVLWEDDGAIPTADIFVDQDTYSATIIPYCGYATSEYRKVSYFGGKYTQTSTVIDGASGSIVKDAQTESGEQVYYGALSDGTTSYYCAVEGFVRNDDVTLSVYRRESNGSFTEIATDIPGSENRSVIDPHPSLDYARYRIVSRSNITGAVAFYDAPGVPVDVKCIVLQWDEPWSNFDTYGSDDTPVQLPGSGSIITLPYNIDVSSKNDPDVALVKYIGRKNPVSYYGTQMGESQTWNAVIDKTDKATLYALRRLQAWTGDAYVREPSGTGYWAHVSVSLSEKHNDLTIPVTFNITRVEGGM